MTREDYIKAEVAKRIKDAPKRKTLNIKFAIAMVTLIAASAINWYFILHGQGKRMTDEQYLDHEVRLRVYEEKIITLNDKLKDMQHKYDGVITIAASCVIIPIVLHYFKLIQ